MSQDQSDTMELTREQLYEQVWTTPIQKLAATYNLSDVGLAKICKKHHIPHPPRGYWAKKQHGKATQQVKLPKLRGDKFQTILLHKPIPQAANAAKLPEGRSYDEDIAELMVQAKALPKIEVPERISRYHQLIKDHKEAQRKAHKLSYRDRKPILNINVSDSLLGRAYRILDTLLKAIERLDGKVEFQKDNSEEFRITIAGEDVASLALREKTRRVDHVPSKNDGMCPPKYDYPRTGLLILCLKREYTETAKGKKLEDRLNRFLIRLIESAQDIRDNRRKWERIEREEREQEQRRQELQRQQREENERLEEFIAQVKGWDLAAKMRAFLQTTKAKVLEQRNHIDEGSDFDKWFKWGLKQADRIDPLEESPPSILDEL